MKRLLLGLCFTLSIAGLNAQAHSIPVELLTFMSEHPDATDAEMQAFIDNSEFAGTAEVWTGDENAQSFNMPPELVDFLLNNPAANQAEIQNFILSSETLKNTDWLEKIQTLVDGNGFDKSPFSLNDLVLLNQIGDTFDKAYERKDRLNWWQFARNYVLLGIEHILSGVDHILFVISLVLLLPPWRRVLKMVTTFTLAHSMTLILAGTNILTLSARIVEPIIAFSIAYMAVTTVFLSKRYPWFARTHASLLVIFIFGLFHGLGFAGQFAQVSPDTGRLLPSLLLFNVGVEFGQLIILSVFVPFLWALKHFKLYRYFIPPFALIIAVLALWWVFVRVFL